MKVSSSIFREYDIRGIAGKEFSKKALEEYEKWYGKFPGINITPEVAEAIGKAYGTLIRNKGGKKVVVGHEVRPYGEELKMQFINGILTTGIDVDDAGISLTPVIYFSIAYGQYDGGTNVTGSHNVYFFNGFKTMGKNVYPIYGEELQEMRKIVEDENFFVSDNKGHYSKIDAFENYKKYLLGHLKLSKKLKVVLDCGNGSAGVFAPQLLREFGCNVVEMYSEPDATFPNHVPDPEDLFVMQDLSKKVVSEKADLGIALDADGDRFGAVDENGTFIYADRMLIYIAKDILSRNKGKRVLYDVKCTRLIDKYVKDFGGEPLMHITGHAPIKATLRKDGSIIFAGEVSGHFYYVENYYKIDDGLYSALRVLSLLSKETGPLSSIMNQFEHTIMTPELKLPCADELKHKVVDKIRDYFKKSYETIDIDGVRILFSDTSWGLVRASNTSPYLTIRVEADTDEEVIKIKKLLANKLEEFPEIEDKLDTTNVTSHNGRLGWI